MNDEKSFRVTDRRIFDPGTGEIRKNISSEDKAKVEDTPCSPGKSKDPEQHKQEDTVKGFEKEERCNPKGNPSIDFPSFVASLHTSAMIHMGAIPNPYGGEVTIEPELARQNIDILEMLEQKTKGNLTKEEGSLLEQALYTLRMKFVEITNKKG